MQYFIFCTVISREKTSKADGFTTSDLSSNLHVENLAQKLLFPTLWAPNTSILYFTASVILKQARGASEKVRRKIPAISLHVEFYSWDT